MTRIISTSLTSDWRAHIDQDVQYQTLSDLENGHVLFFPQMNFPLDAHEHSLLSATVDGKRKNISMDISKPSAGSLHGMMLRFAHCSDTLLQNLLPHYKNNLIQGRTSFRPVEIAGRTSSWRKDDTRLHVDSFPATPVQDKRILRIFTNINPQGKSRVWRVGEPFEQVAARFIPSIHKPLPGSSTVLRLLNITKSMRSEYDHTMLQLHDRMKADLDYQTHATQTTFEFPAGSTWMVYTDQVSHAAMAGQHVLEQTFYLPVTAMQNPQQSPLRVLERLTNRQLT